MKLADATWRWLESSPDECRSEQNQAIDQAIFEAYRDGDCLPTVRLYTWRTPAVSLGRHQPSEAARREFSSSPFVRRPTGGLAVQHGDDLTVSIVAGDDHLSQLGMTPAKDVLASYFLLLSGMVDALREFGIEATYGSETKQCALSSDCFAHLGRCDVLDARTNRKILGSAQRRVKGFVLQQMSLRPLVGLDVQSESFRASLKRHYQVSLGVSLWQNETDITSSERRRLQGASGFV